MEQDRKEEDYNKLVAKVNELILDVIDVKNNTDLIAFLRNVTETELYFILVEVASSEHSLRLVKERVKVIVDRPYPAAQ